MRSHHHHHHHNSSSSSVSSSSTGQPLPCEGARRSADATSLRAMATSTDIDPSSSRDSSKSPDSFAGDDDGEHEEEHLAPLVTGASAGFNDLDFCSNGTKEAMEMIRSTASLLTSGSAARPSGCDTFSSVGKTYHCQRCLNHGVEIARKGHKRYCEFAVCTCEKCGLVEQRKLLNREINSEKNSSPGGLDKGEDALPKVKTRNPKCARCAIHDVEPPRLKGHKKNCPYQNCTCRTCNLVTSRRCIMAKQIHLRRTQKAKPSQRHLGEKRDNVTRAMFDHSSKNFVFRRSVKLLKSFSPGIGKSDSDRRPNGRHTPMSSQSAAGSLPSRCFYTQRHSPSLALTSHATNASVCPASVSQSMFNHRQATHSAASSAAMAAIAAAHIFSAGTSVASASGLSPAGAVALPLSRASMPLAPSLSLPVTTTSAISCSPTAVVAADVLLFAQLLGDLRLVQQQSQSNGQALDNCLLSNFSPIHNQLVEAINNSGLYRNHRNKNNENLGDKGASHFISGDGDSNDASGFHLAAALRQVNFLSNLSLPPTFLLDRLLSDGLLPQNYGLYQLLAGNPSLLLGHQMFMGLPPQTLPGPGGISSPAGALPFGLPSIPNLAEFMRI